MANTSRRQLTNLEQLQDKVEASYTSNPKIHNHGCGLHCLKWNKVAISDMFGSTLKWKKNLEFRESLKMGDLEEVLTCIVSHSLLFFFGSIQTQGYDPCLLYSNIQVTLSFSPLPQPNIFFQHNLLHVLAISKNLLCVSQFAQDNVYFEFHVDCCYVKS